MDVQNLQLPRVQAVAHFKCDIISEGAQCDTQLAKPGPFHLQAFLGLAAVLERGVMGGVGRGRSRASLGKVNGPGSRNRLKMIKETVLHNSGL